MSDFYQSGIVPTLHMLGSPDLESMEKELAAYSRKRPIALILPSLYSDLEGEGIKRIAGELKEVNYVKEIVVTLGPASHSEFENARSFFSGFPQQVTIIWNSGPAVTDIYRLIQDSGLQTGEQGKGRSVWMALGYVLSRQLFHAVALHDCDIINYRRSILARLCYPVINPNLDYDFCKGYYSRVSDRLHGRVTRLLYTPLVRSLEKMLGFIRILRYFDGFRYPLAGEFSMDLNLCKAINIPGDWGLEVGLLAEVYRNTSLRRICQCDIAENYDHKHQELSPEDAARGLNKMCIDICKSLFRILAADAIAFSDGFFKSLVATYISTAQDMLKTYQDDAAVNGLHFDRNAESLAVETFTRGLKKASEIVKEEPGAGPLIANWGRVESALPDILERIALSVEKDNR